MITMRLADTLRIGQTIPTPTLEPTGRLYQADKKSVGDRDQAYTQYIDNGNSLTPVGNIKLSGALPSGVYHLEETMKGIMFEKQSMNTDSLLRFEDPIHRAILGEMDEFWQRRQSFTNRGFLHNRALLMFGPPGSGKSCIVKLAMEDLIRKGDVILECDNLFLLNNGLKLFRDVEPERRCLAIMEDVDEMNERGLLKLLDGTSTIDNMMYLATTNYVNRLAARVLRPGRFDRKIEVPFPPSAGRQAFLRDKLAGDAITEPKLAALVEATRGFSFGHLRELVIGAYCMGQPLDKVIKRLRGSGLESI